MVQTSRPNNSVAPPPTAAPHATATVYTPEQIAGAWTEYKPSTGGATYYYNTVSRQSQWDKPEALKLKEASARAPAAASSTQPPIQWKEYTDASTGKSYYSNGTTTTWDKPEGFKGDGAASAAVAAPEETLAEPPRKKKKVVKRETEYGSKEESVAAFKGLLLAKEISPVLKWNDVVKLCSSDPRWDACEDVLSVGERKQSLAEYQTKRANELKTIERQEKARAKDSFLQLLTDSLPALSGFSAWTSRFEDVRDALSRDDRFHAVATEGTRESLFLDFCEEFKKREERKKRNKKRESKEAFLAFLKEKEEERLLSFASTWSSFFSSLSDEDKSDSRLVTSAVLTDADRQLFFADYVIELQAVEDDKRSRIRGARRRAEKAQREAFLEALHELAENGIITPQVRWASVERAISAIPGFGLVYDQDREAPREIFDDFISEWSETYRRDRSILSQIVYSNNNQQLVITAVTSYEEFTKALLDAAAYSPDMYGHVRRIINRSEPVSSARLYLQELKLNATGSNGTVATRRGRDDSSSEDEGEIVEDN